MIPKCCVCKNLRQDAILHCLPRSEKRLDKWLKCLKRDDLRKLSCKNVFVCHVHFEKRFISSMKHLSSKAYPSLLTEDEISTGKPSPENTEYMTKDEHNCSCKRHFDHTYSKQDLLEESCSGSCKSQNTAGTSQKKTSQDLEFISCGTYEVQNVPEISQNPVNIAGFARVSCLERPKPSRQRFIQKLCDLSPSCQIIHREYKKAQQQANICERAKRASKFKEKAFEKLTANMNPFAKRNLEYVQRLICIYAAQNKLKKKQKIRKGLDFIQKKNL